MCCLRSLLISLSVITIINSENSTTNQFSGKTIIYSVEDLDTSAGYHYQHSYPHHQPYPQHHYPHHYPQSSTYHHQHHTPTYHSHHHTSPPPAHSYSYAKHYPKHYQHSHHLHTHHGSHGGHGGGHGYGGHQTAHTHQTDYRYVKLSKCNTGYDSHSAAHHGSHYGKYGSGSHAANYGDWIDKAQWHKDKGDGYVKKWSWDKENGFKKAHNNYGASHAQHNHVDHGRNYHHDQYGAHGHQAYGAHGSHSSDGHQTHGHSHGSGIEGKAKDSVSANTTRPQQYQRLFLFSNGVLTITPKLQVPYELTGSVASGLSIGLPIKVRFQSQFQLMSEWIKQLLITKAQAYVNGFTNADQHMAKTKSHTSINANNIGTNGGDVVFDNDGNLMDSYTSNTSTVDNGSHVLPDNIGGKGNDSLYFQNKLAKSSRFQARSQLYKAGVVFKELFVKYRKHHSLPQILDLLDN
ncbi:unnamed protein product [Medioppia subpectinata]|uniref:Uncharacterized protein n=1 Tax=Medioppia subpectinata TaxID=1979941 RepID=A0A7R9KZD8_9ACAR|nr:unnamed protein product [Medioppia subpectinata]CAG2112717.1 unnamed protein product [Medioppia subpectinata]